MRANSTGPKHTEEDEASAIEDRPKQPQKWERWLGATIIMC